VVDFEIDRSDDDIVDIDKFYALVLAKQISMEDFVSCCKSSQGAIKDKFGSLVLAKVMSTKPKEDPKLKMKVRK
jgi:hypothetical protein